jgi:hypothetical protein
MTKLCDVIDRVPALHEALDVNDLRVLSQADHATRDACEHSPIWRRELVRRVDVTGERLDMLCSHVGHRAILCGLNIDAPAWYELKTTHVHMMRHRAKGVMLRIPPNPALDAQLAAQLQDMENQRLGVVRAMRPGAYLAAAEVTLAVVFFFACLSVSDALVLAFVLAALLSAGVGLYLRHKR